MFLDLLGGFDVLQQHRELVAAQACQQAVRAGSRAQPFGDVLQHSIAEAVTERVVDGLEVVQIHEQQRQAAARAGARQRPGESRRELAAIGQLGERVVVGEVMQLAGALGHVALKFRLVRAQLRLGMLYAVRHGIEGFGQFGDFRGAAARGARGAVPGGEAARRGGEPAYRQTDADGEQHRDEQHHAQHAAARCRVLGDFGGGRGVLCGLHQAQARRLLLTRWIAPMSAALSSSRLCHSGPLALS